MRHRIVLSLAAVVVCFAASAGDVLGQTEVGDTWDGCDKSHAVSFKSKGGKTFTVKAGETGKDADLDAPIRELEWFCGSSQEFSSNDVPYDRVRANRQANGAIHFHFFRLPPPSGGNVQTANVGDTAAGCHKQHSVTLTSVGGKVSVAASETKIVDLPAVTSKVDYQCGNDGESVENETPFDRVRVSRNINGAIQWTFYLKTAAADPKGACDQVHATGRLVFKDENGSTVGLGNVHVKLMDDDFGPTSSTMAQGWTNADGRFDLTGSAHDSGCVGGGCRRPDPFVEFILGQAHRVDVKDAVENTSRQQSDTKADTCGDVNFGDQMWSNHEIDPILYARAQLVYDDFVKQTGDTRVPGHEGLVGVEYPTIFIGNAPYTTWDTIHWPYYGAARRDFDGVDHEFGHRLRHAADGDRAHFDGDAVRFYYGRTHNNRDVTNEGFAFNEGWAYFYETVRPHGVSFPNGTWTTPTGDDVEGDVANQLFNLAAACGGLPRMWHTLKDSGHNSIHSVDEFRAAFLQRNPGCVAAGAVPTRTPTNPPPPPTPTRSIKSIPGPSITGLPLLNPTASNRGRDPLPKITSIAQPLVTSTPSKQDAEESARLRAEAGRELAGHFDLIAKREAVARDTTRRRVPADVPAAARPAVERLNVRHAELEGTFHAKSLEAYRAAYDSLSGLTRDSLSDGGYEKAQSAAKDAFAERIFAARLAHLQATQREIAEERKKARDPRLVAYLARMKRRYEGNEERLEKWKKGRKPGDAVPPDFLPRSFVETTTAR